MIVCFFFKQKTAYEMRISDWSSDVCSSDLELVRSPMCAPNAAVTLNLVKERVNRARGHRIAADEQRMKAQRLAKLLMLYEAGNDGINRTPRLIAGQAGACAQSGRASCRERVCQYV